MTVEVPQHRPRAGAGRFAAIVLGFVVVHVLLLVLLGHRVAATADELVYIGAGHAIRADFTFATWIERLQGPVPLYANQTFLPAQPEDLWPLLFRARLGMLPFSVLLLVVAACWARQLWGVRGAVLTMALATFSPNLLGYGALTATDLAFTSFTVATLWAFWHWLRRPDAGRLLLWGASFGVCIATKYLALLFVAAFPVVVVIARWRDGWRHVAAGLAAVVVAGVASLLAVHACYLFSVPMFSAFDRLHEHGLAGIGSLPLVSDLLRLLPEPLVLGIDHQKNVASTFPPGRFGDGIGGHWAYYLVALGSKMPLGALALVVLAVLARPPRDPRTRLFGWVTWVPAAMLWAYTSLLSDLQIGIRYVLPIVPLMLLHAGGWLAEGQRRLRQRTVVAAIAVGWVVGAVSLQWPHLLGFFNPLVGGPQGGHRWYADSNCEWGQTDREGRERLAARHPDIVFLPRHATPRLARVASYVTDRKPDDPRRPGRTYHWLDKFEPEDHYAAAWLVYRPTVADFERAIAAGHPRAAQELALAHVYARDFAAAQAAIERAPEHEDTARIRQLVGLLAQERLRPAVAIMQQLGYLDMVVSFLAEQPAIDRLSYVQALAGIGDDERLMAFLARERAAGTLATAEALACVQVLYARQRFRDALRVLDDIGELPADDPLRAIVQAARDKLLPEVRMLDRIGLLPR